MKYHEIPRRTGRTYIRQSTGGGRIKSSSARGSKKGKEFNIRRAMQRDYDELIKAEGSLGLSFTTAKAQPSPDECLRHYRDGCAL